MHKLNLIALYNEQYNNLHSLRAAGIIKKKVDKVNGTITDHLSPAWRWKPGEKSLDVRMYNHIWQYMHIYNYMLSYIFTCICDHIWAYMATHDSIWGCT